MPIPPHPACSVPGFPGPLDGNVTFVIGTFDGNPVKFQLLKEYVCKAMYNMANSHNPFSFNLIHFSREVFRWCDRSVRCKSGTVAQAVSWVQTLESNSSDRLTEALSAALEDETCQAVYLVMDSLPAGVLMEIYSQTARLDSTCTVNVVYLLEEPDNSHVEGSFRLISLHPSRSPMEVTSDKSFGSRSCCDPPCHSVHPPQMHLDSQVQPISCSFAPKELPVTCSVKENNLSPSLEVLSLLRGARVLAQRDTDGYYYLGHITREIEGSADRFLIEFEKCRSIKGKPQFRMQETPISDIVHYEDARWKPLAPGDHVLAPQGPNMEQYGPGTVLHGAERRDANGLAYESSGVLVTFWNGKTKQIPPGLAVRIPQHLSDRITLNLHLPREARKKFAESISGLPFVALSRNRSSAPESPSCASSCQSCMYCVPSQGLCRRCCELDVQLDALRKSMGELRKITRNKEKKKSKSIKVQKLKVDNSLNKTNVTQSGVTQPRQDHRAEHPHPVSKRETATDTTDLVDHGPRTKSCLVTRGGSPEFGSMWPFHRPSSRTLQETLSSINKAMREDRLALEAAIRENRPHTAPLVKINEMEAQRSQELRDRKEADKVNLRRKQTEQRNQTMEKKIQEMQQREQMMQESRRFRSGKRIQLDLERRQDQEGLTAQREESRREVTGDRDRKQEEARETERKREAERVQFCTNRRKQREETNQEQRLKSTEREENRKKLLESIREAEERKAESDIQDRHRHQNLQEGTRRKACRRLDQFYRKVEQESQKDLELQKYLKERNLQTLRSVMIQ